MKYRSFKKVRKKVYLCVINKSSQDIQKAKDVSDRYIFSKWFNKYWHRVIKEKM